MSFQSKRFSFTLNYKDDEGEDIIYQNLSKLDDRFKELVKKGELNYFIAESERGDVTGRLHIQGYLSFASRKSVNQIKTMTGFNTIHLEKARLGDEENAKYCRKDAGKAWCIIIEGGTPEIKKQGKRTDWLEFINACKEGMDEDEADEKFPELMIRYRRSCQDIIKKYKAKLTRQEPAVFYYYGTSGSGKTTKAIDGRTYYIVPKSNNGLWLNGYDWTKHEVVIFDEVSEKMADLDTLKQLTDKFQTQCEGKCCFLEWNPPTIVFTSQLSPLKAFPRATREDMIAFIRRCTKIIRFTGRWSTNNVQENVVKDVNDDPDQVYQYLFQLDGI